MTNAAVAHSLPPASARGDHAGVVPGTPDIWVFVLFECVIFSSYFIIYMLYRMHNPALFLESQAQLNPGFGVANTLILLTSSWLIARCVQSARELRYDAATRQALLTILLGVLFVGTKAFEWSLKVAQG